MPAGRLVRLSKMRSENEFPAFVVATPNRDRALELLELSGLADGRTAEHLCEISERVVRKLGLQPDEIAPLNVTAVAALGPRRGRRSVPSRRPDGPAIRSEHLDATP
jgi:hypothetical protein